MYKKLIIFIIGVLGIFHLISLYNLETEVINFLKTIAIFGLRCVFIFGFYWVWKVVSWSYFENRETRGKSPMAFEKSILRKLRLIK